MTAIPFNEWNQENVIKWVFTESAQYFLKALDVVKKKKKKTIKLE